MGTGVKAYRRLPGSRSTRAGHVVSSRHQLWLGKDHILAVTRLFFSEDYRRFYFRDLRSIVVQRTVGATVTLVLTLSMAMLSGLLLAVGVTAEWGTEAIVFLAVAAGLFAIVAIINGLQGPSCRTYIQTAVQRERLWSLGRLRRAQKAIRVLRQRVQEAQGPLAEEDLASRWEQTGEEFGFTTETPDAKTRFGRPDAKAVEKHYYHGTAHAVLFFALLCDAAINGFRLVAASPWYLPLELAMSAVLVISMVTAMILQGKSDMPGRLKWMPWSSFIYISVLGSVAYFYLIYYSIAHPDLTLQSWELLQTVSMLSSSDSIVMTVCRAASTMVSGCLGVLGFRWLYLYRNAAGQRRAVQAAT